MRVYIDGVFDLFHRGHLEALKKTKYIENDVELVVGVISDKDTESYKRIPIICEKDRVEIIKSIRYVDEVIFPAPLILKKEFLKNNNIHYVVHGFSDENDRLKQRKFYKELIEIGKFKEIKYYDKCSTTEIISKIIELN